MRANVEMTFKDKLEIPLQYNYLVQAMILNWLGDEKYQKFIHDKGYEYNNRIYKMYTFSKLYGKFSINSKNDTITFYDKINLIVSSLDKKFIQYLASNILIEDGLRLGRNIVKVNKIQTNYNELGNSERIYTKSPITIYSTLQSSDKKKTYYYSPYETEFSELIKNNLINKYRALYNELPKDSSFNIQRLGERKPKESVLNYKGTIIKGWNGEFLIEGSKELLQIAYDAGIGSKNSQGFGCIELKD